MRQTLDLDAALDASLVLEAMGIAHDLAPAQAGGWALLVADGDAAAADAALAAWEAENAPGPPPAAAPAYGPSRAAVWAAIALAAFDVVVALDPSRGWVARGAADAARMLDGAWWRAATALTLHADAAHVAGNAVALAVFGTALAHRLGPAVALWAPLAAGVAGNAATALVARSGHVAVGASTATFGALATLSALQAPGRRAWVTMGVGLALLGMLGTGERADLLAHLFGFLAGAALGLALRRARPPRRGWLQPALAAAAAAPLVAAWWRALR